MKRLLILILLLAMAGVVYATPSVLRSYTWNDHKYTVIQLDNGNRMEIKGAVAMTDEEALSKAAATVAAEPVPLPDPVLLATCTKAQMKAEVLKRGYTALDLGLGQVEP